MKYTIEIESKFDIGKVIVLGNDQNNKYMTVKITGARLLIGNELDFMQYASKNETFILTNNAFAKPNKTPISYMIQYCCRTMFPSWYNTKNIEMIRNHFNFEMFENELLYRKKNKIKI